MHPACKKCGSTATRRTRRKTTLSHRLRYFLGFYPWECLTCQARFFSQQRYPRGARNQHGEVYVGDKKPSAPEGKPLNGDRS